MSLYCGLEARRRLSALELKELLTASLAKLGSRGRVIAVPRTTAGFIPARRVGAVRLDITASGFVRSFPHLEPTRRWQPDQARSNVRRDSPRAISRS